MAAIGVKRPASSKETEMSGSSCTKHPRGWGQGGGSQGDFLGFTFIIHASSDEHV